MTSSRSSSAPARSAVIVDFNAYKAARALSSPRTPPSSSRLGRPMRAALIHHRRRMLEHLRAKA